MAKSTAALLQAGQPLTLAQVADGAEGLVLADLARAIAARPDAPAISLAVICRDGQRMAALSRALAFFGPDILTMEFPAWDCLPYDRVSPNASVVAQRMTALSRLTRVKGRDKPSGLLTTVNAALQRGVHCGEQQRRLVAPFHTRQSRQRGHALRHHGRIGRHPVVGQTIPGREFHGENVWPEERQRARQRRHALAVAADHRERNRRRIGARRDGQRMAALSRALAFFGPDIL